ncbi:HNH endonuclease [Rubrobacter radiotolerans]|uniref:HNH endonuclease n=1 Tax=Rubrobacter radiotolerans TaxID=42256 RepID=A0A023X6Z1_RUBRA|nr:hypothetical protein [Rubrobacter radiotolerans]AHY47795.1 HNH endonuclease [Rubrobacter radiotolerans]MDX5892434.1 hypothetical protein [Rubrobacter radiotolerans]SMC07725.1 hypothetical protein SAMN00767673_2585 [Rubrobacter radiotolerans DSM 5868]
MVDGTNGTADTGVCELCGRAVGEENITRHHLLPKSRARKLKRKSKKLRKRDLADADRTVGLCRPCHRNIHASVDNKDLEREYDTLEKLAAHPDVRRFTEWVRTRRNGAVR